MSYRKNIRSLAVVAVVGVVVAACGDPDDPAASDQPIEFPAYSDQWRVVDDLVEDQAEARAADQSPGWAEDPSVVEPALRDPEVIVNQQNPVQQLPPDRLAEPAQRDPEVIVDRQNAPVQQLPPDRLAEAGGGEAQASVDADLARSREASADRWEAQAEAYAQAEEAGAQVPNDRVR